MSNTKSSGGQSSKGFLHWLKNTWLGKLWNWIVSCFRPKKQKTEPQSSSKKEEVMVSKDNESKSSEVEQNRVNGKHTSISNSSQTSVNSESPANRLLRSKSLNDLPQTSTDSISSNASQISSNASLSNTSLPESLAKSRDRSQSSPVVLDIGKNENQTNTEQPSLEWDNEFDIKSPKKDETPELSSPLKREPSSSNIENSDDEATKREQSKSKAQHTSRKPQETKNQLKQGERRKGVSENRNKKQSEDEKKGEQTLKKSEEKLSGAAKRKQIEDKKKSEKARDMRNRSISNDRFNFTR